MHPTLVRFAYVVSMVTTGLVAGVFVSEYIGISPVLRALGAEDYVQIKQAIIRAYNPAMPLLGIGGSITYVAWLLMLWKEQRRSKLFRWAAMGFALLTASTVTTMLGELPANATILAMNPTAPPADWSVLRFHTMRVIEARTLLMVLAFGCLALGSSPGDRTQAATQTR
jgi:hypothetical protein